MSAEEKAKKLGVTFESQSGAKPYLNMCARNGNLLFLSGHVSDLKGKLGADVSIEDGYAAARDCAIKLLKSARKEVGSLDELRIVRLLGCVNSTPDFIDQHLVINGASDLLHELFGKEGDGYHARSAVGFVSLPTGVAVEIEAIFAIK